MEMRSLLMDSVMRQKRRDHTRLFGSPDNPADSATQEAHNPQVSVAKANATI